MLLAKPVYCPVKKFQSYSPFAVSVFALRSHVNKPLWVAKYLYQIYWIEGTSHIVYHGFDEHSILFIKFFTIKYK